MSVLLFSDRVDLLDNPAAGRVGFVSHLSSRKSRTKYEQILVEGPQAVRELVKSCPDAVRDVYIDVDLAEQHREIVELARSATDFVHPCTRQVVNAMSSDAQGICAVANTHTLDVYSAEDFVFSDLGLVVVLARVQDPGNAGTMIRVADAFGADAVFASSGTVDVLSPKVIRSTAGSSFHLPLVTGQFSDLIQPLRARGAAIVGTSGSASLSLDTFLSQQADLLTAPVALVFGNEARGLSEDEMELCDYLVSIPMYGKAESLNVATAAAVVTSAVARLRH